MKSEISKTVITSVIAGLIVWAITSKYSASTQPETPKGVIHF